MTCALCNEACLGAIVKAFGNAWHPRCFKCSDPECGKLFTETDAVGGFGGKPYCVEHRPLGACNACGKDIFKRHVESKSVLTLNGGNFHRSCLKCSVCSEPFGAQDKILSKDGALFCHADFYDKFGEKCATCGTALMPGTPIVGLGGSKYHQECVVCKKCGKGLRDASTGRVRACTGADGSVRCPVCS